MTIPREYVVEPPAVLTPFETVLFLFSLGLKLVFWPGTGEWKGPREQDWINKLYTPDDYRPNDRVGIMHGVPLPSGDIVHDVDLDWAPGVEIGKAMLPATQFIWGRTSKGLSHCLYGCPDTVPMFSYRDIGKDGKTFIEFRSDKHQSMAPPSIWEKDGVREPLTFVIAREITRIESSQHLKDRVRLAAIGMMLAHHFGHNGFGHEARLAWAGYLMRAGVADEDLLIMGRALSRHCNNTEVDDVGRVIASTRANLEREGKKVKGGPALARLLGEHGRAIVARMDEWLGRTAHDDFPFTETGDAEHFAALYADRAKYDARRSRWLLLDEASGLWLVDPVEQIREYGVEAMRLRQEHANAIDDLEKRKQAWNWAVKGESTSRLSNLIREARVQPGIRNDSFVDPWDAHPFLLGVPSGVVDLRTGETRKARPDERITMCTSVDYDPAARSELWERALREISDDDPEWVNYLQRIAGYTTTGCTAQDKFVIEHGKNGREGKGTIDGALSGALGDYVIELPSAVFELRPRGNADFDLSYLPSKRLVLSSETGNTIHLNHDRIKKLTGGGSMRVANKFEKSYEFVPTCKLWLACNDLPTVTDDSAAFWARVIVIPFRRSFLGKEDTTLRPTLSNDPVHRRAVLAWLIRGAIDYCRDGLGDMPESVAKATKAFREVAWPLTPFVTEDCEVKPDDPAVHVSVGHFNLAYHRFCERQGIPDGKRLGWKRVVKLMEARYDTVEVDERARGGVREKRYMGIGLKPIVEESKESKESKEPEQMSIANG